METLFQSDYVKIKYDSVKQYLIQEWSSKYAKYDVFKEAIDKTVGICEQKKVKAIISDTRVQPVVDPTSSDYAASIMPKLIGSGLRKFAFVMSKDIVAKLGVDSFTRQAGPAIIKHFDDFNAATKWVTENTPVSA